MPYIWNPKTKRSEWQNTWNGQDYGAAPAPTPQILPPGEHGNDPNYGGDPNAPAYSVDPTNPVDADGNGIAPAWDANPTQTPTTPAPSGGTSAYDQAKAQMDAVFAKSGRAPRADEYAQWIGPNGYIMRDDINGAGQTLKAYTGGEIDPYWQSRMTMHATGDYYGNGTTPTDANSGRAQPPSIWQPPQTPATTPAPIANPAPSSTATATPAVPTTTTNAPNPLDDAVRDALMQLLNTSRTVDPETIRNSPEMQAMQLAAQRSQERDRAALAERAAVGGWSGSGGFEGGLNALNEGRGETEMAFAGTLATQYMERQREDLQHGIELAMQYGQFDKAQALQRELADLNAAVQREQIAQQAHASAADNSLGFARLGLDRDLGFSELDLRRYMSDMDSSYNFANLEYMGNRDVWNALYGPNA